MHIVRSKNPILFFSKKEKHDITEAICQAELKTSAEIRVHLERRAGKDIFVHAKQEFQRLGMTKTAARNGVLIFLGVASKRFAILGDRGINDKVPPGFWDEIALVMTPRFKEDEFATGLCEAILMIGEKLSEYFPYHQEDVNELPDEISYSF